MSERVKIAIAVFTFMTINVLLAIGVSLAVTNQQLFENYHVSDSIPRTGIEISSVDFYDMREDGEKETVTGYILTVQETGEKYLITDMIDPIQMSEEVPSE